MASVVFAWVDAAGKASTVIVDASPARTHTVSAQATEHPVEQGVAVTDYIRPMPRRLSVDCFITNTPIGAPPSIADDASGGAGIQSEVTTVRLTPKVTNYLRGPRQPIDVTMLDFLERFDRVKGSFVSLAQAVLGGALFRVTTAESDYANMAALSMVVQTTPTAASALQFTMEFQEIRIVSTRTVAVPARKAKKDAGVKVAKQVDPASAQGKATRQSFLSADVSGPDATVGP